MPDDPAQSESRTGVVLGAEAEPHLICGSHSMPYRDDPKSALTQLLSTLA